MAQWAGSRLGDYEILAALGAGAAGEVFKVRHVLTGRIEAIKVLHPGRADSPEETERFLREIQLQASLQHLNIAAVYNAYRAAGRLVMVMEFVDGRSLRQILDAAPVSLDFALDVAGQALAALEHAHAHNMIHRDIKPENILVRSDGVVKLTDFGLAKSPEAANLTHTAAPLGSLWYISPEQVRAVKTIDARTDLYSMGAVLYELVTGRPPFEADSAYELMKAHVETVPRPPMERNRQVPPLLNDAILTALRKNPAQRFASATEFRRVLEKVPRRRAAAGHPLPVGPPPGSRRRISRRAAAAAAGVALGIGCAATLSLTGWPPRTRVPALEPPAMTRAIRPPEFAYQRSRKPPGPEPEATPAAAPVRQGARYTAQPEGPAGRPARQPAPPPPGVPAEVTMAKTESPPPPPLPAPQIDATPTEPAFPSPAPSAAVAPEPALALMIRLHAGAGAESVVFGPGGVHLAAFSRDRVTVWELLSEAKRYELTDPPGGVTAVAFSGDGRELFTGNGDGTVRIWALDEQREIAMLGHESGVRALALPKDGNVLLVSLDDKSVRVWRKDPATGGYKRAYRPLKGSKRPPAALAYSAKANLLAGATANKDLVLWRAFGGKALRVPGLEQGTTAVSIRPPGDLLAAAGPGGVALWQLPERLRILTLPTGGQVHALAFLPAGRCLAVAAGGRTVRLWDVIEATPVAEAVAPALIRGVCLSRDGKRVAAVDAGGEVSVWQLNEAGAAVVDRPLAPEELEARVQAAEKAPPAAKKRNLFRRLLNTLRK